MAAIAPCGEPSLREDEVVISRPLVADVTVNLQHQIRAAGVHTDKGFARSAERRVSARRQCFDSA
jgi:hypothetical protein